ncbi:MAG: phage minor capsid protein [Clostridia bacterium]|jgi:phage minor capsid protein 2|nr:phage minor capsid protein [Clostridia bacterium]DAN82470.1 MAG TPA: minor capsid protein [Caudoviricetes sp.]DAT10731.1 MAG TPA: minor capsid protein [Caudoviricetes sp.]
MLTPDYLEHCADEAIKINAELENFIIKDIARRIVQSGVMTETARHQIKAIQESGYLYNDIIAEIANISKLSTEVVKGIFEDAAIETMTFDDKIYELAGLKPTAFRESPTMMQILKTGIQKANNDINNLTMTSAGTAQSKFKEITNMAYRQYTSGAFDYNTAIFNAIEQLSKDGINVMYPSGKLDKIDVAVRRAVLTGVSQTANKLQDKRAEEMNCDLVEVTAHIGARVTKKLDHTNHAWWQGKVYSISGNNDKYPSLKEITGYGKVDGLGGINCRHNKFPFIEGFSKRAYTDKELEEINNKTVTYNGKEYGEYEALKMQRQKERNIRETKREIAGYQGIMLGSTDETILNEAKNKYDFTTKKLKKQEKEIREFIKQTGLKRNNERERVVGVK